jgi:hypothetical protein
MADKRDKEDIKVTDRRRFSFDGEVRHDDSPPPEEPPAAPPPATPPPPARVTQADTPPPPEPPTNAEPVSEEESQASRDAFREAGAKLDEVLDKELGPQHRPEALQVSFETFIAELYMSAMLQLGLLHERGQQPQVDLVGARHTVDTISMLEEKTRGNLSANEAAIVQDCLFRLRMAFVEVTNVLTRPPAPGGPGPAGK